MTTPALRAAALAMARLYSDDGRAERRAEHLEEHARVAVVAWLRAEGGRLGYIASQMGADPETDVVATDMAARSEMMLALAAELDPPASPIGEDQDD